MVAQLAARGESKVLDAICDRKRSVLDVWASYRDDANVTAVKTALSDANLEPYVEAWRRSLKARGRSSADAYTLMLRRFVPESKRFMRSAFTRSAVREFLTGLPFTGATANRHRSVIHAWARWLIEEHDGLLEANPVSAVRRARENARTQFYSEPDVKRLIEALSGEARALEATMVSTGMEWSAVERLRRRNVDLEQQTLHAHGSKDYWRDRVVVCTLEWCWPYIERHCRDLLPDTLMFTMSHEHALDAHHAAVAAKKLAKSTLHDWRHTHAILMRRAGMADHLIAKQLGHRDTALIATRYARFTPDTAEVQAAVRQKRSSPIETTRHTTHDASIGGEVAAAS